MIDEVCLTDTVLAAAQEVFNTMIFMDTKESSDSAAQKNNIEGDTILGLITFKGDLQGCLGIYCNLSSAKAIALSMLAMEPTEELDKREVCDALGEVANMVMGSIKTRLAETVSELDLSIPTVISGQRLDNDLGDGTNKASVTLDIGEAHCAEFSLQYRYN